LKNAIKASRDGAPIDLLVKQGETYRTVRIDYRGGTRYPKLERIKDTPALFDDILTKKK
jgi:signal transduction histidine kinase